MKTANLLCLLSSCLQIASCYIIDGAPSPSIMSKFHNVQCKLLMTIDQTTPPPVNDDTSAYDENFFSVPTSSKFGIPLDLQFTSSTCTDTNMNNEPLLHGNTDPPDLLSLEPLVQPTYITLSGQKSVKVTPGAYACQLSHPQTQQFFFRFFLDFPEGAARNDVELPAERVYFMSSCWIQDSEGCGGENAISKAKRWRDEIRASLRLVALELEEMEGVGLVERTRQLPRYIELMKERQKLMGQIDMLEERFPLERPLMSGPGGTLFLKDGVVAVKRLFEGRTRYHWIGTFSFKDFLEGDDGKSEE